MATENIIVRKPLPMEASFIKQLMDVHTESGLLLERNVDEIKSSIDTFLVAEAKEKIIGVVSGFDYGNGLFEVRSLVVDENYGKQGTGSLLVRQLIGSLKKKGAKKIFALSYSPEFFRKNGFYAVDKQTLPEKIWKDCRLCKNQETCGETALVYLD